MIHKKSIYREKKNLTKANPIIAPSKKHHFCVIMIPYYTVAKLIWLFIQTASSILCDIISVCSWKAYDSVMPDTVFRFYSLCSYVGWVTNVTRRLNTISEWQLARSMGYKFWSMTLRNWQSPERRMFAKWKSMTEHVISYAIWMTNDRWD